MNLGQNTAAGFLPAFPSVDDVFDSLRKGSGGWNELANVPSVKAAAPDDELLRAYASIFSQPAGRLVLEDLLDMSIRRSPYLDNLKGEYTLEKNTLYGLERKGQNGIVIAVLSKILKGRNTQPAKKSRKK